MRACVASSLPVLPSFYCQASKAAFPFFELSWVPSCPCPQRTTSWLSTVHSIDLFYLNSRCFTLSVGEVEGVVEFVCFAGLYWFMPTGDWNLYLELLVFQSCRRQCYLVQLNFLLPLILLLLRVLRILYCLTAALVYYRVFLSLSVAVDGGDGCLVWLSGESNHSFEFLRVVLYSNGDHCLLDQFLFELAHVVTIIK